MNLLRLDGRSVISINDRLDIYRVRLRVVDHKGRTESFTDFPERRMNLDALRICPAFGNPSLFLCFNIAPRVGLGRRLHTKRPWQHDRGENENDHQSSVDYIQALGS